VVRVAGDEQVIDDLVSVAVIGRRGVVMLVRHVS
jgi:hypothetical protein